MRPFQFDRKEHETALSNFISTIDSFFPSIVALPSPVYALRSPYPSTINTVELLIIMHYDRSAVGV